MARFCSFLRSWFSVLGRQKWRLTPLIDARERFGALCSSVKAYGPWMRDSRVKFYRTALDGIVESLEAVVTIARWEDPAQAIPSELRESAEKLVQRLGAANRLSTDTFVGAAHDVAKLVAIRAAMKRLDGAYLTYRQQGDSRGGPGSAATLLESELGEVKAANPV